MDGLKGFNDALDYIEQHLDNKIDYAKAAQIACCSEYHLSRMFSTIAGVSLSEYVRRRRLTRATFELQNSDERILDLALKYGYESADSFSRAFKKMHGIKPSKARGKGIQLVAYPKLSFHITIAGETEIVYRIETLEKDITIIGKEEMVLGSSAPEVIPKIWERAQDTDFFRTLMKLREEKTYQKLGGFLGVYRLREDSSEIAYDYMIGISSDKPKPEDMMANHIEAGSWIVFSELKEVRKLLFTEWMPTLGYEIAHKPFIECFYEPDHIPQIELWVPIVTK